MLVNYQTFEIMLSFLRNTIIMWNTWEQWHVLICINFGRRLFGSLPCIEFCRIWVLLVCLFVWKLYIYKQTSIYIYIYMNCQWSYPDIIVSHTHFVWHFVTNWGIPNMLVFSVFLKYIFNRHPHMVTPKKYSI